MIISISVIKVTDSVVIAAGGGGPNVFAILKTIRKIAKDQNPHFPALVFALVKPA
jgi:hypothetical protein